MRRRKRKEREKEEQGKQRKSKIKGRGKRRKRERRGRERRKGQLTCGIGGMDDGVPVLDVLNNAANQPLGTFGCGIDSNEPKGASRSHDGITITTW
jgi:hypothetical protein